MPFRYGLDRNNFQKSPEIGKSPFGPLWVPLAPWAPFPPGPLGPHGSLGPKGPLGPLTVWPLWPLAPKGPLGLFGPMGRGLDRHLQAHAWALALSLIHI